VKASYGGVSSGCLLLALKIHGHSSLGVLFGANAVNRLLHLAVTAVASLDGVGRCGEEFVVQKSQGLFEIRGFQFVQTFSQTLEALHTPTEATQFFQGGVRSAPAIEQPVDFVHDLPQRAELRLPTNQLLQGFVLANRQTMTDEQMAMFKKFADPLTQGLRTPMTATRRRRWSSTRQWGCLSCQLLAQLGDHAEHHFGQIFQRVKFADLMGDVAENRGYWLGIQGRGIGRDSTNGWAANSKRVLQPAEKSFDVGMSGNMIKHLEKQTPLPATVHDRQDTERSVIKFVGGNVPGEIGQRPIKVDVFVLLRFFSPKPRSSFGSWRKEQKHDDRARGARMRVDTAVRPRPPNALPRK
jgi:hypothetical protein